MAKKKSTKQIDLTVVDRLLLPNILPQQGGRITMLTVMHLSKGIEFSQDEIAAIELRDAENGKVAWNLVKGEFLMLGLPLTPEMIDVLKDAAKRMDEAEAITAPMLPLIEKIFAL